MSAILISTKEGKKDRQTEAGIGLMKLAQCGKKKKKLDGHPKVTTSSFSPMYNQSPLCSHLNSYNL